MSALTLRGPAWVAVRQHRRTLWTGLVLLALFAGILLYWRLRAGVPDDFAGTGCTVINATPGCRDQVRHYLSTANSLNAWFTYLGLALALLPAALGAFVAGPMIAREFESGTYQLAWSQSVSPARWLAAKLVTPAAVAVVSLSVFAVFYRWTWVSGASGEFPRHWYEPWQFVGLGPLPVAYALLGIAVGALTGLLVRRTVPAMTVAALTTGVISLAFVLRLRAHLMPVSTVQDYRLLGEHDWTVQQGVVTAAGRRFSIEDCFAGRYRTSPCASPATGDVPFIDYHPATHFWPLQLIETGIVLVLAAVAAYAAFRVLRRRHA
ncbi:ABC transporter permease [Streptomyces sp. NPDC051569]|uniref:ABC transporter permease n=1 Tax=Streptomyces sp. NPDC051569 TaxID=3365661 RepID=UPI00378F2D13